MFSKSRSLLCCSTLAVVFVVFGGAVFGSGDDPDSSQAFIQHWADTWLSGDVEKMMDFYSDSPELVVVESLGKVRKGRDGVRAMYRDAFDELRFEKVTLTRELHAREGDFAWSVVRFRAEVRLENDGSRYVLESRGSFAMRRHEENWKIVMEHFSTIPETPRVRPLK